MVDYYWYLVLEYQMELNGWLILFCNYIIGVLCILMLEGIFFLVEGVLKKSGLKMKLQVFLIELFLLVEVIFLDRNIFIFGFRVGVLLIDVKFFIFRCLVMVFCVFLLVVVVSVRNLMFLKYVLYVSLVISLKLG